MDMDDMPCKRVLEAYESTAPETIEPAEVHARPRDDHRTLPPALRDLLLADTADELEVMEEDDDPYVARVVELRDQAKVDRTGAFEGFSRLVEELEAKCARRRAFGDRSGFKRSFAITSWYAWCYRCWKKTALCESFVRPMRWYFAQHEICSFTPSKRTLNERCPRCAIFTIWRARPCNRTLRSSTCLRVWSALTIIEVARHGLRIASDRSAIGYLFYRLAFAYWNCDQLGLALACYRLVPRGEESGSSALEEMQGLMNEMGVSEPPIVRGGGREPSARLDSSCPPVSVVTNQLADAAVQLVDNGFFFLARGYTPNVAHHGNDELGSLNRFVGVGEASKEEGKDARQLENFLLPIPAVWLL